MNLIRRYLMVVCVGVSLLFGIQVPNFLDQYAKRVDAHLREVKHDLQHYQKIAAKYHNNDLQSLIDSNKNSGNPTFKDEGFAIEDIRDRKQRFDSDEKTLRDGFFWSALRVVTDGDRELLRETVQQYSYAVPLNQNAIASGVAFSVVTIFLVEALFGLLIGAARRVTRRPKRKAPTISAKPKKPLALI